MQFPSLFALVAFLFLPACTQASPLSPLQASPVSPSPVDPATMAMDYYSQVDYTPKSTSFAFLGCPSKGKTDL